MRTEFCFKQHEENTEWSKKIQFYRDELIVLQKRLEEIAFKHNHENVLKSVCHFQIQWIIQHNNMDKIQHQIKMNEESLMKEIKQNPVTKDHQKMTYLTKEKETFTAFEHVFNALCVE